MFYGLLNLPFWGYIVMYFALTHVTSICITLFLHRHQAHKALELHAIPSHFFRFWIWLTTGMETKAWTAIHRKHHAHCETEDDPHSPQVLGIQKVMWQGSELYRKEAKNAETLERYGHGTPDDWIEKHLYTKYSHIGIWLMLLIDIVLMGVPGVIIWALQMSWSPVFAAGIINGVGHFWGYRNFECPDAARNIVPWGILVCGEELHNNHHAFATSARFSVKPWEFDIGWCYIRLLSFFGLAKVKRTIPELHLSQQKSQIDFDTVKALLINRFEVMARYSRDVVAPVFQETKASAAAKGADLKRKIRNLLVRDRSLVDAKQDAELTQALSQHPNLAVVYQLKQQLQDLWDRRAVTQRELIEALQDWCRRAEQTGIRVLQDFAHSIRKATLQTAEPLQTI
jgi:stearoyl-CoA desaturase (delta-9 desaturase)